MKMSTRREVVDAYNAVHKALRTLRLGQVTSTTHLINRLNALGDVLQNTQEFSKYEFEKSNTHNLPINNGNQIQRTNRGISQKPGSFHLQA